MHRLLAFCLAMLAGLLPAAAAERVLLAPPGFTTSLSATPSAAPGLQALRARAAAQDGGTLRVIVGLRVPFAAEGRLSRLAQAAQRGDIAAASTGLRRRFATAVARHPEGVRSYASLPFVAMAVTAAELDRLSRDPQVISLEEDRLNSASLAQSAALINAPAAWSSGFSGQGQTVAILDTGVDKTHPFLAGKVVAEACFSDRYCPGRTSVATGPGSGMPCANKKECQHGTHVAGIAAGRNGNAGGVTLNGIAKDASIIAVQVFSRVGSGIGAWDSDILAAGEYVYSLRDSYRIAAVNLSLGGGQYSGACDGANPAGKILVDTLRSAGIATVVASGNSGWSQYISSPACISSTVSVGSVSDSAWGTCWGAPTGADVVACYSNAASMLSLLAPGSVITSSVPGGKYAPWHGTSMATPHVAGAFAVLKQAAPLASVTDLLTALQSSGKPVTDYRWPNLVKPRIDIAAALGKFRQLKISRGSLGTVNITANGASLRCGEDSCTIRMLPGTAVTLQAQTPLPSFSFLGWLDATCHAAGSSCSFSMPDGDVEVNAAFGGPVGTVAYVRSGTGAGSVHVATTTGGYDCAGNCNVPAAETSQVTVTATASAGSIFGGWTGACSGTGACSFAAGAGSTALGASFNPGYVLSYVKAGTGTGSVSFAPAGNAGASCSGSCDQAYAPGTSVTLTAVPAKGAKFRGWSGACTGKKTCTLAMAQARSVTATFTGK